MPNYSPGRPSIYQFILARLEATNPTGWYVIDDKQKTQNAPSSMRKLYPGWDFKCTKLDNGLFTLEARKL